MKKTSPTLAEEIGGRFDQMVALRRDFHRHPELSFQEHRTAEIVAERLEAAGLEVRTGVGGPGVVGVLRGDKPGRTVAWRADIDALPIQEDNDLPFASEHEGVMHACGHDGHTAIGLALAGLLAGRRAELPGTVVFIFQPAEEGLGGAKGMIAAGALENPHVDCVLGLHLSVPEPVGNVIVRPGAAFASADFFDIEITGKGGHGALPHFSIDPITVAAHILIGLQDLITREVAASETAVLTVGQVEAGSKHNIIPTHAYLRGSIRAYTEPVRDQLVERLGAFASRIAQAYRAEAKLVLQGDFCPAVENDVDLTGQVRRGAVAEFGEGAVSEGLPIMASDDMSLFLRERPGCYFRVGAAFPGENVAHHHPNFRIDEESLRIGLRVALRSVLDALKA